MNSLSDCWESSSDLKKHIFDCLNKLDVRPSRSMGQNYLRDANVIKFQVDQADIEETDIILEIGGGPGTLTKCLANKAKKVYTIEYDRKFVKYLRKYFKNSPNVEIIQGDAVKIKWPYFNKCVANLPFQISSPVTFKLLEHDFDLAILMYQKEFARRMLTKPGTKDYSRLSVMVKLLSECKYLRTVGSHAFYPQPRVNTALIAIRPNRIQYSLNFDNLSNFITVLFTMKGKTVRSALNKRIKKTAQKEKEKENYNLYDIIHSNRRIFTLKPEELVELYLDFKQKLGEEFCTRINFQNMK